MTHTEPADLSRSLRAGILALMCGATAAAQTLAPAVHDAESIRSTIASVQADAGLPDEVKAAALQYYDRAITAIEDRDQRAADLEDLNQIIASAPDTLPTLEDRLSASPTAEEADVPPLTTDDRLQALIADAQGELTAAREALEQRDTVYRNTLLGGEDFSARLIEMERRLAETETGLRDPPTTDAPRAIVDARATYLAALSEYQAIGITLMRNTLSNYELLFNVATLERNVAKAEVERIEGKLRQLEERLQAQRAASARQERREAEAVSAVSQSLPPPVAAVAEENVRLRAEIEEITEEERQVTERLRKTESQLENLEADLASTRRRVEVAGGSDAIGRLLRRRLARLPSARDYRRAAEKRRRAISRLTDRRIDVEELRSALTDLDDRTEALIASIGPNLESFERDNVHGEARELLSTQREILGELDRQYRRLGSQLVTLDVAENRLVTSLEDSADFIRQTLFRIRSLPVISLGDFAALPAVWDWLASPRAWMKVLEDARTEFSDHPMWSSLALLALVAGFYLRARVPKRLAALAKPVGQIRTDSIIYTVRALALSVLAASVWPLALVFTAWHVLADPIGTRFNLSVGWGLMAAAVWLWLIGFTRWLCHPYGLGTQHLRRPRAAMIKPRASLRWLGLLVVPGAFLITATEISGEASFIAALGRPLLVLSMLAMGLFFWRVYKLFSPIIREMRRKAPDSYWSRTRGVWVMLLVSTPLALALASILGYHYAASNLTELLALTLFYLLALLLLNEILLRWLYVSERRLRLEAALRQREENRAEREKASGEHMDAPEIDVPELDYKSLGAQGRAMVRATVLVAAVAGLLTVWSELLPAFSVLDAVHLPFSRTTIIDGVAEQVPVTLLDLGVAFLILVGTLFAAKNLSGFLEFTVLKHINIDIGGRYAIVTLCQYVIVAVGVIACFSVIGWKWSNIQWLVAALSVGLGFGLQEIVANFVSGIILLLERPIRIGDTVTIGDQGGVVSRIQIRATTIITWEKKELLVPNKEFITGRVLNWSLTGELTRVLINVGIAYGADVTKAMKLILETAKEHEHIVEDPEPIVTFEAFGDNSLSLFLRAYCDSLDLRLHVMTELNEAIYGKLNAAGIPIAFPQRDVHLDTLKPLEIKVLRGQTGESGA